MQTDVKSGHLNNSGFVVLGRNRLKAVSMVGTATAGTLDIFDTTTAPVAATGAVVVSKMSSVPAVAVPTIETAFSLLRPKTTKPELLRWPDLTSVCIIINFL